MSRRRRWVLLGLVVVLLLAALGDALAFGGWPLSSDVAEATWTLEDYASRGTPIQLPSRAAVVVVFHRVGHTFSGADGCNLYFGSFSSFWPGRLRLSNLGQTVVGCPGDRSAFERRYLVDLLMVDGYRTTSSDSGLVLSSDTGQVQMHFTAGSA